MLSCDTAVGRVAARVVNAVVSGSNGMFKHITRAVDTCVYAENVEPSGSPAIATVAVYLGITQTHK